jgi:CHAT domain-containing protein
MAERSSAIFWVLNCPIYLLRCYSIRASSNGGAGNTIKLTSLMGKIDTNGGLISSTSLAGGNAGAITLNSAKDIKVGDIFARSRDGEVTTTGVWNGGRVTLDAGGNIESGNITTTSITGNAGKVTLEAGGDIEAGAIATSSQYGAGGNIKIEAGGESIKIVNSLSRNDNEYSVYSAGATKNGRINIQQTGETDNYFEVGDATYNGTKGGIYAGLNANGVVNNLLGTTIVVGTYVDGNIKIVTPDSPASLRKAKQLAPEKATLPTTFNPVALSAIQGFIDKGNSALSSAAAQREYRNAIVALDNFRTIEFYQSQGNTSPPVPQLDSVSKIKSFLNAGDIAANTKSAMIYTFLSGTTQDNPYDGTSLNLFAVTSTSDVIYRTIPLINGQYLGLTVKDTVAAFRAGLLDANSEDYKEPASRLYDLIFRPLKDALSLSQVNNLIFSTDSLFRVIPLAALYDKQSSEQNGKFLVEDFSSSVTPSFQVIEKDRYQSLKGANVIKMGATEAASDFARLPSVRTELENIAKIELQSSPNIKHSPIYLNQQFSKSNLQTLIAKNDSPIIHLATHGIMIRPNSDGYVQLGTTQSASLTNRLTASEIRQLNGLQNKELLVFSACQTVLSIGNISYGLAGAALVAGVKSSTGSCWDVSDEGNMILMTGFYQQLLGEGLSKTKALQKTQKAMLLKMVETTPVDGTTDKAELSINGIKVESSEYGQRNIKRLGNNPENYLDHPFYWCGTFLLGNPW